MYNPTIFVKSKVGKSMKLQLLSKHGVYEKRIITDEGYIIILVKHPMITKQELIEKGFTPEEATTEAMNLGSYEVYRSNPGESFKDFMIRIGWIYESNGKYEIA